MRPNSNVGDADFYDFDEARFMTGKIQPSMIVTHSE